MFLKKITNLSFAILFLITACTTTTLEQNQKNHCKKVSDEKVVLGKAEWVYINKIKKNLKARIDTGARTSSLSAINIKRFERDGKNWLRFNIPSKDGKQSKTIEAMILRNVTINKTTNKKQNKGNTRPVIKLQVHLGNISTYTEFNLTDRSQMVYPVLIGRSILQDRAIVDVGSSFLFKKYKQKNMAK
ncbi:MAG: ATP-dependent zinc protease [Psychromonas sp.]|nr:ATP-dependent zinc protease [Psychromonas sp.]